jgi:hypothetical protein
MEHGIDGRPGDHVGRPVMRNPASCSCFDDRV